MLDLLLRRLIQKIKSQRIRVRLDLEQQPVLELHPFRLPHLALFCSVRRLRSLTGIDDRHRTGLIICCHFFIFHGGKGGVAAVAQGSAGVSGLRHAGAALKEAQTPKNKPAPPAPPPSATDPKPPALQDSPPSNTSTQSPAAPAPQPHPPRSLQVCRWRGFYTKRPSNSCRKVYLCLTPQ